MRDPLEVDCNYCGAVAGDRCLTRWYFREPHLSRRNLANPPPPKLEDVGPRLNFKGSWHETFTQIMGEPRDCHWCGKPLDASTRKQWDSASVDHVIPQATLGRWVSNETKARWEAIRQRYGEDPILELDWDTPQGERQAIRARSDEYQKRVIAEMPIHPRTLADVTRRYWMHYPGNLVWACWPCNIGRGNRQGVGSRVPVSVDV